MGDIKHRDSILSPVEKNQGRDAHPFSFQRCVQPLTKQPKDIKWYTTIVSKGTLVHSMWMEENVVDLI